MSRWSPRRKRLVTWILLGGLILAGAFLASRPGSGSTDTRNGAQNTPQEFAAIDEFVEGEMAAQRVPGLALAVVKGNKIAYMRGFGEADGGRGVTPQTPFIIGSVSKSFTALAVMQLVEAGKIALDAPVQRYLPWFRVADEEASAQITVRHLLHHTSGLSTKTGRSFQGNGDTSDKALENAVRKLSSAELAKPVGSTHQYSTINFSVLGLIVQTVSRQSYETYIERHVFEPLDMRRSFTSEAEAKASQDGLAGGHHYWFSRPRAADVAFNRGLLPAGYLIASAEDVGHYVIAQLNRGRYGKTAVLSPAGIAELHHPAVPTTESGKSYAMGWFVGPINGIPAIHHQGETFNFHANVVLTPGSRSGVVVLMNAENSLDLFTSGRMGTIADGVASLLADKKPEPPPSNVPILVVYGLLFGVLVLQISGMIRSARALRRGTYPGGRLGPRLRIAGALGLSLIWAAFVLVLLPKQLGVSLLVLADGMPDLVYALLASALVALGWGVLRTVWGFYSLRKMRHAHSPQIAPT